MNNQPESHQRWRAEHPEKVAEYSRRHMTKVSSKLKQIEWKKNNKDKTLAAAKRWRDNNKEKQRKAMRKWREKNREYINAKERERCISNPSHKIAKRLRSRMRNTILNQLGKKKAKSAILIGCDIAFLMGYLEARFKPGMKWANYGEVWEIDHRIPCASYDLTDESHQRSCFHYSNLQPLFVSDNRRKHAKMPGTHQAELI